MTKEEYIDEMHTWLIEHYEDPNERLPYESREGGYMPIYGPIEATIDILQNNFGGDVADDIIDDLASKLGEYELWSPIPDKSWCDENYGDIVFYDTITILQNAEETLQNIEEQILIINNMDEHNNDFMRMLFAKVYATIESFLFDFFVNYSLENLESTLPILDGISHFKKHPISLKELDNLRDSTDLEKDIETLVKEKVSLGALSLIWHRFDDVGKLYKKLGFKVDTTELKKYLYIRNDIVHRDGRKKEDMSEQHLIEASIINQLVSESRQIINTAKPAISDEVELDIDF